MRQRHVQAIIGVGLFVSALTAWAVAAPVSGASVPVKLSRPALHVRSGEGGVRAGAAAGVAGAAGIVPPSNPAQSVDPSPNFTDDGSCAASVLDNSAKCQTNVAQAIANGRSVLENMGPLQFNMTAFESMTVPQQLFVIANVERTDRGLSPIAGLTTQLDNAAQTGANNSSDPTLSSTTLTGGAPIHSWGSNWAGGTSNALGSDYYWMYDDGVGSNNESCTSPSSSACWGHRDNVLGTFTLSSCSPAEQYMGAGDTASGGTFGPSFSEIFVGACGATPTDVVYTWAQAQQALNTGGGTTTTTTTTTTTRPTTTTTTTSTSTTTTTTTTTRPTNPTTTTTTAPARVPSAPRDVVASSSVTKGVVVTWLAPASDGGSPVTGYKIYRSRSTGNEGPYATVACTAGSCSYSNKKARSAKMFFYTVAAVNKIGTGPNSTEVSAKAR
jgi:hypothetical protein